MGFPIQSNRHVKRVLWRMSVLLLAMLGAYPAMAKDFYVGVGTHFGQNRGDPQWSIERMREAGVMSFRDEIFWSRVEPQRGRFVVPPFLERITKVIDLATSQGIEPVLILAYGNSNYDRGFPLSPEAQAGFVRYAEFIVTRFKGKVRFYEVWNEWNGGMGAQQGDKKERAPAYYLNLLKQVYPAIKRIDPQATVLGGSVEGAGSTAWIEEFIELGATQYMDALSIHPYMHHAAAAGTPENLLKWLNRLIDTLRVKAPSRELPLYITEVGWPNNRGDKGIPEQRGADYLARVYLVIRTLPSVRGVWWYSLQNDGNDRNKSEQNFGLTTADGQTKPAYLALKDISGIVERNGSAQRILVDSPFYALKLSQSDGRVLYALWDPSSNARTARLDVRTPTQTSLSWWRVGNSPSSASRETLAAGERSIDLKLDGTPVILETGTTPVELLKLGTASS